MSDLLFPNQFMFTVLFPKSVHYPLHLGFSCLGVCFLLHCLPEGLPNFFSAHKLCFALLVQFHCRVCFEMEYLHFAGLSNSTLLDSTKWSEAAVVFVSSESSCVVEFMLFFTCVSEVTTLEKESGRYGRRGSSPFTIRWEYRMGLVMRKSGERVVIHIHTRKSVFLLVPSKASNLIRFLIEFFCWYRTFKWLTKVLTCRIIDRGQQAGIVRPQSTDRLPHIGNSSLMYIATDSLTCRELCWYIKFVCVAPWGTVPHVREKTEKKQMKNGNQPRPQS